MIELGTGERVHCREISDEKHLVQTNHYDLKTSPFTPHNVNPYTQQMQEKQWYDSELLKNSQKRKEVLQAGLDKKSDLQMQERLISLYKQVPVLNWETAQWVRMKPKTGEIDIYACTDK